MILDEASLTRLETFATADMSDPATADNCRRFAHEALPDLLETIRYWQDACDQLLASTLLGLVHSRPPSPLRRGDDGVINMDPIVKAVDMVGRSGARSFELGYHPAFDADGNELDEATTPASEFRWWAKATFKGAVLAVDDCAGPVTASVALAQRVRKDARCAHCQRVIAWGSKRRRYCWWTQVDGRWEPGCRSES